MYSKKALAFYMSVLLISGCGGSDNGSNTVQPVITPSPAPVPVATSVGVFIDSAVSGLSYQTASQVGVSNSAGEFNYIPGEIITFSIGDVVIGSALAESVMTPLSLVPEAIDETHPEVTNIVRFLLTLDADGDPANGIELTADAVQAATGKTIDFSVADLTAVSGVVDLLNEFSGATELVGDVEAQRHFNETLSGQSSWGSLRWGSDVWKKSTP